MFEKEAEKWADKMYPCDGQAQRYILMGAEFGYNKANEELEKENAQLKSKNCWKTCEYAEPKSQWISQHIQDVVQLTKAKKIIRNCLNLWNNVMTEETVRALIKEAEQFLKEND